ncbi:hypothetical protein ACFVZW_05615 [Streptomyces sp. NPDC059567]|uniref:hypothetical protein n=1 Tax=Streptomyces sp. NPDC059567 TaxID=3346867 RepID=UPI0036BC1A79
MNDTYQAAATPAGTGLNLPVLGAVERRWDTYRPFLKAVRVYYYTTEEDPKTEKAGYLMEEPPPKSTFGSDVNDPPWAGPDARGWNCPPGEGADACTWHGTL